MSHLLSVLPGVIRAVLSVLLVTPVSVFALGEQSEIDVWNDVLRPQHFADRPISIGESVVDLNIPLRAEDAGIVPVSIHAGIPQTADHYIKELYVFIDNNPIPLAAHFHLTPEMGKADLAMRLRINTRTMVRVVAETNTGELYMDEAATRASGGCTLPPPYLELKEARTRIGQMKFRSRQDQQPEDPDLQLGQLIVSHPNVTGLQLDQRTRSYIPAEYMTHIRVSYQGREIFSADTGISISEDPSFRFFFRPEEGGSLQASMTDNKGRSISREFKID